MFVTKAVLLTLLGLQGCAHQLHMDPPTPEPVFTSTYAYQEVSPDTFQIWTHTDAGLAEAKDALGCGVCVVEPRGALYVYRIQLFKQPK